MFKFSETLLFDTEGNSGKIFECKYEFGIIDGIISSFIEIRNRWNNNSQIYCEYDKLICRLANLLFINLE